MSVLPGPVYVASLSLDLQWLFDARSAVLYELGL